MNIGNRVRQLRRAKNMKIAELAEPSAWMPQTSLSSGDWQAKALTEQTLSGLAGLLSVLI